MVKVKENSDKRDGTVNTFLLCTWEIKDGAKGHNDWLLFIHMIWSWPESLQGLHHKPGAVRWANCRCNQQVVCLIQSCTLAVPSLFVSLCHCVNTNEHWAVITVSIGWQRLSDVSLIRLPFFFFFFFFLPETGCVFLLGKLNVKCRFKVVMAQQYLGLF